MNQEKKEQTNHPYVVGRSYLIRTVTHYYTGRITGVYNQELVLEDAAWIAYTGRYMNCFDGPDKLDEIEPIKDRQCIIGRGSIVDCVEWTKDLPRKQK